MPPTRRHDIPAYSLDALALQVLRQDYSSIIFRQVFRPSLVFHYDLRYDPYHREYASTRNPLTSIPLGEEENSRRDNRVFFETYLPHPSPNAIPVEVSLELALDEHYNEQTPLSANKRIRRLSSLVIELAILMRCKLRSTKPQLD